jgi:hypothetical protein
VPFDYGFHRVTPRPDFVAGILSRLSRLSSLRVDLLVVDRVRGRIAINAWTIGGRIGVQQIDAARGWARELRRRGASDEREYTETGCRHEEPFHHNHLQKLAFFVAWAAYAERQKKVLTLFRKDRGSLEAN